MRANRADPSSPSEPRQQERTEEQSVEYRPRWLRTERLVRASRDYLFIATGSEVELAVAATKN